MKPRFIAVTGGPSAGKTMALKRMTADHPDWGLEMIPEAATMLFGGGFIRAQNPVGVRWQQTAIYAVQNAQEKIHALTDSAQVFLCDRGTLDGLAYVTQDEQAEFIRANSIEIDQELARYSAVFQLEIAPPTFYDQNGGVRCESYAEAQTIQARLFELWSKHPRYQMISSQADFSEKFAMFKSLILNCIRTT